MFCPTDALFQHYSQATTALQGRMRRRRFELCSIGFLSFRPVFLRSRLALHFPGKPAKIDELIVEVQLTNCRFYGH